MTMTTIVMRMHSATTQRGVLSALVDPATLEMGSTVQVRYCSIIFAIIIVVLHFS